MKEVSHNISSILLIIAPLMFVQLFTLIRSCKRDLTTWNDIIKIKEGYHNIEIIQKIYLKIAEIESYISLNVSLTTIFVANVIIQCTIFLSFHDQLISESALMLNISLVILFFVRFKKVYQNYI